MPYVAPLGPRACDASFATQAEPCPGHPFAWQGTESEHGVPTPLPDGEGRDVERGGFTRAVAQSCRPDDCLDDLAFDAARERAGSLPAAAIRPRQVPGGQGGPAGQRQPQAPGASASRAHLPRNAAAYHLHNPRPANGWGPARRNRNTGRLY